MVCWCFAGCNFVFFRPCVSSILLNAWRAFPDLRRDTARVFPWPFFAFFVSSSSSAARKRDFFSRSFGWSFCWSTARTSLASRIGPMP